MKKLIALVLVCLAIAVPMPAFAATAGPEAPTFAIDQAPIAGTSVEISFVSTFGEKEVSSPLGSSMAAELIKMYNQDRLENSNPISLDIQVDIQSSASPPGYYLLV